MEYNNTNTSIGTGVYTRTAEILTSIEPTTYIHWYTYTPLILTTIDTILTDTRSGNTYTSTGG